MKEKILLLIENKKLDEAFSLLPYDSMIDKLKQAIRLYGREQDDLVPMLYWHILEVYIDNEDSTAIIPNPAVGERIAKMSKCIEKDNLLEAFALLPDDNPLKLEYARLFGSDLSKDDMIALLNLSSALKMYVKNIESVFHNKHQ